MNKHMKEKLLESANHGEISAILHENKWDSGDFYHKYKPIYNHITGDYKEGQTEGESLGYDMYFETYDKELEYVKKQPNNKIWTLIEEDGITSIFQGYHFVNRLNYLIATVPYKKGEKDSFRDYQDATEEEIWEYIEENKDE
jgi:hypothetical protein